MAMEIKTRAFISLGFLLALVPATYLIFVLSIGSLGEVKPTSVVPGISEPLRLSYTGVAGIDQQLVVLFKFFWPVVNGTEPGLSLFSVYFFGEISGAWALILLEGIRSGNRGRAFTLYVSTGLLVDGSFLTYTIYSTTVVGVIFQNATYACTMPVLFALYFWTSPTIAPSRDSTLLPDAIEAISILPALVGGFLVPSILAALPAPSIVSHDLQQILVSAWQVFPLWVGILQQVFRWMLPVILPASMQRIRARPRIALRTVYIFALFFIILFRASSLGLSFVATLFPMMFAPGYASKMSVSQVFLPATASLANPPGSVAAACLLLLQYDQLVGSNLVLAWAFIMLVSAGRKHEALPSWPVLSVAVASLWAVLGPGGCAVTLMWARDEMVLSQTSTKKKA